MPGALFPVMMLTGIAMVPAARAHARLALLSGVGAFVLSLVVLLAWLVLNDRRANAPSGAQGWDQRLGQAEWAEFEQAFWSYVEECADDPSRPAE